MRVVLCAKDQVTTRCELDEFARRSPTDDLSRSIMRGAMWSVWSHLRCCAYIPHGGWGGNVRIAWPWQQAGLFQGVVVSSDAQRGHGPHRYALSGQTAVACPRGRHRPGCTAALARRLAPCLRRFGSGAPLEAHPREVPFLYVNLRTQRHLTAVEGCITSVKNYFNHSLAQRKPSQPIKENGLAMTEYHDNEIAEAKAGRDRGASRARSDASVAQTAGADIQAYRRLRDRRREVRLSRGGYRSPSREAEVLVGLAQTWAPFGGPPDEEIFIRFGITRSRFTEKLWRIIAEGECSPEIARHLEEIYPSRQPYRTG